MSPDPSDLTPHQRIAHAWNEIMNARAQLPTEQYLQANEILNDLDVLLLAIRPEMTDEPVVLTCGVCGNCGGCGAG